MLFELPRDLIHRFGEQLIAIFKRRSRSRLRQMMRGYRYLKTKGQLELIQDLQQTLRTTKFSIPENYFSKIIFGAALPNAELVLRQQLMTGELRLNRALLIAKSSPKGKVISPIPKDWFLLIERYGFVVDHGNCTLLWHAYLGMRFLYSCLKLSASLFQSLHNCFNSNQILTPYIYFCDLTQNNLPCSVEHEQSYDVISWYMQWCGRRQDFKAIYHSVPGAKDMLLYGVPVQYQKKPIPALKGWKSSIKYGLRAAYAFSKALVDWLRGQWWHVLILPEAVDAMKASFVPSTELAVQYLFHNSRPYPPLWSYETQMAGSDIVFYFYSTNCEGFQRGDDSRPLMTAYSIMNWPTYLVWDFYQADFVARCTGKEANIEIVGSLYFTDKSANLPPFHSQTVAVFDVQPHRSSRYTLLALTIEYYVPGVTTSFLDDINEEVHRQGGLVLLKQKREIGKLAHPRYRNFVSNLKQLPHVILVDAGISAFKVIEKATVVISMPFTSTALIARDLGKPSAYYDPLGMIQKDDPAAHGIPILIGPKSLAIWLKQSVPRTNQNLE